MWCITKMVNVYKFHKQLAVTLWTLFKQVKINPPKNWGQRASPGLLLPKMTFVKNLFITRCPETLGDNFRLFTTWWMRSPLCTLSRVCSHLTERKRSPCPFSALLSHGNDRSMHTHTDNVWWEQVKTVFHKEEGWPVRMLLYIAGRDY